LRSAGITRLLDVRLKNSSQLAGFTKREDLPFFLKELCGAEYIHEPLLSPTEDLLAGYRAKLVSWPEYEQRFSALLAERGVERVLPRDMFAVPTVLLCTEPTADRCHRRLVIEYLNSAWGGITARHL
jgi:uncharacterized protein (DUF488 family)